MSEQVEAQETQEDKLKAVAQQLVDADKKVQLIYAFNGTGKTRLSRAVKELVAPKPEDGEEEEPTRRKILYYSAFTEDLFVWDNDTLNDEMRKINIQPNDFTDWILNFQGDEGIVKNFRRYTDEKLTPEFPPKTEQFINERGRRENRTTYPEVIFSHGGGGALKTNIKISKGEESNFVWSVFLTLLQEVIGILQEPDKAKREDDQFDGLQYVFIDDPVSSLDENHLIELAFDLAGLINSSRFDNGVGVKFVVTTHNPLFYNVLHKEISKPQGYLLQRKADGSFVLEQKNGAANKSFSYHLYLRQILEEAIVEDDIQKFHFNLLRNLYEKTANFLGYEHWTKLLKSVPDDRADYLKKLTNHYSHRELSFEEVAEPTEQQKQDVDVLLKNLINNYGYFSQEEQNA